MNDPLAVRLLGSWELDQRAPLEHAEGLRDALAAARHPPE